MESTGAGEARACAAPARPPARALAPALALALALALAAAAGLAAASARAQPANRPGTDLDDEAAAGALNSEMLSVDVRVRVVNGTTRQPGQAESVVLQESGPAPHAIAAARDVAGEVVLRDLILDETRTYLVLVSAGGISYAARATGRDLAAGPVTVYTFTTTTDRSALAVSELNLVIKRAESKLELEYLITIVNETSPQQTVVPDPTSFELLLPEDAAGASLEVLSGPAPQTLAPVAGVKPARAGLALPIRSGATRLRATTSLPYNGRGARLRLESSLPVRQLTLLTFPADLEVEGGSFDDAGIAADTGYRQWRGAPLGSDQTLEWDVSGGAAPRVDTGQRLRPTLGLDRLGRAVSRARGAGSRLWIALAVAAAAAAAAILLRRRGAPPAEPPENGKPRRRRRSAP